MHEIIYKPHIRSGRPPLFLIQYHEHLCIAFMMSFACTAPMSVAGSTSSCSSPSPSFGSFSSGKTVAWWKESSSSPSPSSMSSAGYDRAASKTVVAQVPSARYGGLQRSMAIGRKRGAEIARRWSDSRGVVYV
ncbi:hypothetical protein BDN71DRAFT_1511593 [Pleurotus eryngii]|uniref:Uncharacterized protein n=1 Tax=Pleurotus eryngii TaxID=5323 RepID=A0A9P5ZMB3_PLEER|nr:hypothetical protein BDN71DRAFT_1511593 [Pleurotus eryngii]